MGGRRLKLGQRGGGESKTICGTLVPEKKKRGNQEEVRGCVEPLKGSGRAMEL